MENLYQKLSEKGILMPHRDSEAFCDTFGIPYKKDDIISEESETTNAIQQFGTYSQYKSVRKILEQ